MKIAKVSYIELKRKRYSVNKEIGIPRGGINGLADRLVAWWTGEPIKTVKVTASAYAKSGPVQLEISQVSVKENK